LYGSTEDPGDQATLELGPDGICLYNALKAKTNTTADLSVISYITEVVASFVFTHCIFTNRGHERDNYAAFMERN
jgi:hypothetical protein